MSNLVTPTVFAPTEWDAQVDYDLWTDYVVDKDKVVVHYGGNASWSGAPEDAEGRGFEWPSFEVERAVLRIYEQSHLSRGWRGIAYGWAVGQTGNVYRLRGWNLYGAHRGDLEPDGIPENLEAIPILMLIGGAQTPTAAALESLEWLVRDLERHGSVALPMFGHQEIAELGEGTATACPGVPMMAYIDERRVAVPPVEEDDVDEFYQKVFDEWDLEDVERMEAKGWWDGVPAYFKGPGATPAFVDVKNLVRKCLANGVAEAAFSDDVSEVDIKALEQEIDDLKTILRSV